MIAERLTELNTLSATLGDDDGSVGTAIIGLPGESSSDPGISGGTWNIDGDVIVGNAGRGTIAVLNGGTINSAGHMTLGNGPTGEESQLGVGGSGSQVKFHSITVDFLGSGAVNVFNGGKLVANTAHELTN